MSEYLIAVDLEGISGVVGEPYESLTPSSDYAPACENAIKEINTAVASLFDHGATRVAVWDNHGAGDNLDFSKIDKRAEKVDWRRYPYRMDFALDYNFKGIIYIGYHAREGSFNGILAHTFNSKSIQYVKIDSKPVGELEIDSYIAATHGMAPIFCSSDKACVDQFRKSSPETVFVVTKYGTSRNSAELRPLDEVLRDIYDGVASALERGIEPISHPLPLTLEVRYTRAERAAEVYAFAKEHSGVSDIKYGDDTHTLFFTISEMNRVPKML